MGMAAPVGSKTPSKSLVTKHLGEPALLKGSQLYVFGSLLSQISIFF